MAISGIGQDHGDLFWSASAIAAIVAGGIAAFLLVLLILALAIYHIRSACRFCRSVILFVCLILCSFFFFLGHRLYFYSFFSARKGCFSALFCFLFQKCTLDTLYHGVCHLSLCSEYFPKRNPSQACTFDKLWTDQRWKIGFQVPSQQFLCPMNKDLPFLIVFALFTFLPAQKCRVQKPSHLPTKLGRPGKRKQSLGALLLPTRPQKLICMRNH